MHFTNPKFQAFDGNGNPLSGGKLYTYTGGTDTAKATYSTRDCSTTANANPIVLNSRGEAVIYGKGNFKFILKDKDGVTIWSFDDILMSSESLWDSDRDTGVQVEEDITGADEDKIRFDTGGTQRGVIDATGWHETVSATDYKLANFKELWGSLQRSKFVYGAARTLTLEPGAYWCQDKYCSWAIDISKTTLVLTSGKFYDVYLDYSTITSGTVLTASNIRYVLEDTEVATWNDTYRGWYSDTTAEDRCIGAIYASGSNAMAEFFHDGGDLVVYADQIATEISTTNIGTDWANEATLKIPSFCRKALAQIGYAYVNGAAIMSWRTEGQTASTGHICGGVPNTASLSNEQCIVIPSSNLKIDVKDDQTVTNTASVYTAGYFLPIGM